MTRHPAEIGSIVRNKYNGDTAILVGYKGRGWAMQYRVRRIEPKFRHPEDIGIRYWIPSVVEVISEAT